jgi:SAM-dependent methyltransferase
MRDGEAIALEQDLRGGAPRPLTVERPSTLSVIPLFVRQAWHEARVRWLRHIQFRSRENRRAREAYAAMDPWEFEGINARQAWANWRTIPKNLGAARASGRRLRAADLCCGTGQSTAVLAFHLARGSEILGLEFSPRLACVARSRQYLTSDGRRASVFFRAQSVLETFRDADGVPLAEASVDLVNSSGAVGCHFDAEATRVLAAEVARVLRPSGVAMIDSGRSGTSPHDVERIFTREGFFLLNRARSCFLDPYLQLCFRKGSRAQ